MYFISVVSYPSLYHVQLKDKYGVVFPSLLLKRFTVEINTKRLEKFSPVSSFNHI